MLLRRIHLSNLRSIRELEWTFEAGSEAGWHVVLGNNGSGKTSLLRAVAHTLLVRHQESLRQDTHRWVSRSAEKCEIELEFADEWWISQSLSAVSMQMVVEQHFGNKAQAEAEVMRLKQRGLGTEADREILDGINARTDSYFSCGFGPFRRLGARHRAKPEVPVAVARHLSLFGENDELADALEWLQELEFRALKARERGNAATDLASRLMPRVRAFFDHSGLLPFGARLGDISPDAVSFIDGNGVELGVHELSDGYRSIIGLAFELVRLLAEHFGPDAIWSDDSPSHITASGIVLIDEVDAHLHPAWQREIGWWFTRWFPNIQFIATTHSPLVCQAAERGTILKLSDPGSDEAPRVVTGLERERLLYGNVLDAYSTDSFGHVSTRSDAGVRKLQRLAALNAKARDSGLDDAEIEERERLLEILPTGRHRNENAAE